jgi:hypothetical protein
MTTIAEIICRDVGILESRELLQHAATEVDNKITQLIRAHGLVDNITNRGSLIFEARASMKTLRPVDGFALYLHDLYEADSVQKDSDRNEIIKNAIQGIQNWKKRMDSQLRAGHKMPVTQDLYQRCKKRIEEIDPNHAIRDEIESEKIGPQLKTLGIYGSYVAASMGSYHLLRYTASKILGATTTSSLFLTSACIAFYKSIRSGNKMQMMMSGVFLAWQTYSSIYTLKALAKYN